MHKLIPVSVVATAVFAAGCGGGGDNTLTKSQVIARGTVICKAAEKRVEGLPQPQVEHPFAPGTSLKTRTAARRFLAGYADALESSRAGLAKLSAPSDGRPLLDGYLSDLSRIEAELRNASTAPASQVESDAQRAFAMFDRASDQTKRYGFAKGVCGSGSS